MNDHRFAPSGPLALEPRAFGMMILQPFVAPGIEMRDGVAIVSVRGPLEHHASTFCDSYERIVERVAEALDGDTRALLLAIDSPGGVVSGCFDAARQIRSMAAARGVPILAYVKGNAASAGYALACAGRRVLASSSSTIGSIGVIASIVDARRSDEMAGVRVELVASGKRKADACPHAEITDDARAAQQTLVDDMAQAFFELVDEARGIGVDRVRALEAALFVGQKAVDVGLVDRVCSFDEALSLARSFAASDKPAQQAASAMAGRFAAPAFAASSGPLAMAAGGVPPRAPTVPSLRPRPAIAPAPTPSKPAQRPAPKPPTPAPTPPAPAAARAASDSDTAERARLMASRADLTEGDPKLARLMEAMPIAALRRYVADMPRTSPPPAAKPKPSPAELADAASLDRFRALVASAFGLQAPASQAPPGRALSLSAVHGKRPERPMPAPHLVRAEVPAAVRERVELAMGIRPRDPVAFVDGPRALCLGVPHRAPRPRASASDPKPVSPSLEALVIEAFGLEPAARAEAVTPLVLKLSAR